MSPKKAKTGDKSQEAAQRQAGETTPVANPFPFKHDNRAGVERSYYSNKKPRKNEVQLRFRDGDPGKTITDYLEENGYHEDPLAPRGGHFNVAGAWVYPTDYETRAQDRLHADRVFDNVVEMMLAQQGTQPSRQGPGVR